MSTLVVDASFTIAACGTANGFAVLDEYELVAPALMWSEARSAIREQHWRDEITQETARIAYGRLADSPIKRTDHADLHDRTWRVAQDLGWAKTYDAEYVALAEILDCKLVTLDGRLRRGADRRGRVIMPDEL